MTQIEDVRSDLDKLERAVSRYEEYCDDNWQSGRVLPRSDEKTEHVVRIKNFMKSVAVGLERALRSDRPPTSKVLGAFRRDFWQIFKVNTVVKLRRLARCQECYDRSRSLILAKKI